MALAQRLARTATRKAVMPRSPARYMRGPPEVYARYTRLHPEIAQIGVALFCDALTGIGGCSAGP